MTGLCGRCLKREALDMVQVCELCWFYVAASKNLKPAKEKALRRSKVPPELGQKLRDLWESQGRLCALTGVPISPGNGMSLDHIVPKALGGGHEISNLQWVTRDINSFKRDLTPERFIELCREVVAWADRKK